MRSTFKLITLIHFFIASAPLKMCYGNVYAERTCQAVCFMINAVFMFAFCLIRFSFHQPHSFHRVPSPVRILPFFIVLLLFSSPHFLPFAFFHFYFVFTFFPKGKNKIQNNSASFVPIWSTPSVQVDLQAIKPLHT